jgi:hypothetical protein
MNIPPKVNGYPPTTPHIASTTAPTPTTSSNNNPAPSIIVNRPFLRLKLGSLFFQFNLPRDVEIRLHTRIHKNSEGSPKCVHLGVALGELWLKTTEHVTQTDQSSVALLLVADSPDGQAADQRCELDLHDSTSTLSASAHRFEHGPDSTAGLPSI